MKAFESFLEPVNSSVLVTASCETFRDKLEQLALLT